VHPYRANELQIKVI